MKLSDLISKLQEIQHSNAPMDPDAVLLSAGQFYQIECADLSDDDPDPVVMIKEGEIYPT